MENKLMYDPKITLYRLKLVVEMFGAQLLDEPTSYNLIKLSKVLNLGTSVMNSSMYTTRLICNASKTTLNLFA